MFRGITFSATIAIFGAFAAQSHAATILQLDEVNGDVVGTFSGSLDLTGATSQGTGGFGGPLGYIEPDTGGVKTKGNAFSLTNVDIYGLTGGGSFGSNLIETASSSSVSDFFAVQGGSSRLFVDAGATLLNMSGQLVFSATNFAVLGVTDGASVIWSLDNGDTITINVGDVSPVPLPASAFLLLGGLAGLIRISRSKRA